MDSRQKIYLLVIVIAQFCCTSLWFASNGVLDDLISNFNLDERAVGTLSSAVQFGFIAGTILFALISLVDRFSPSKIFLVCAILGSLMNLGMLWEGNKLISLILIRFTTGFFLAGIYPVGMKIAADHFEKGLGKSLGFLVGALVIGTAFPHAIKAFSANISWQIAILAISIIAFIGGVLMIALVPDGPFRRPAKKIDLKAIFEVFKNKPFRSASFGYFGHMWELYAFWVFVPIVLNAYAIKNQLSFNVSLWAFIIIAIGGLACIISGLLAERLGAAKVARISLILSGLCCLLSPFLYQLDTVEIFLGFLAFWGMVVVADSPLLSTLVANYSEAKIRGTALTIVTGIGFAITIFSILFVNFLFEMIDVKYLLLILSIGPAVGIISLWNIKKDQIKVD